MHVVRAERGRKPRSVAAPADHDELARSWRRSPAPTPQARRLDRPRQALPTLSLGATYARVGALGMAARAA